VQPLQDGFYCGGWTIANTCTALPKEGKTRQVGLSFHAIGGLGFSNRNSVTSGVFIELFAFPIRNITLILKRRAKATCEAIRSARAFAHLVCGELSDRDPPMCFSVSASSAVPSVAFLSSSLIALTVSYQIVVKLGIGDAKGAVLLWPGGSLLRKLAHG
jgi:hypothetical protein